MLKELDVVALLEDLPSLGLTRGMVGAVVVVHEPRLCSVEFVINREGETALATNLESQLLLPLGWGCK